MPRSPARMKDSSPSIHHSSFRTHHFLKPRVSLDEVYERGRVVGEARAPDATRREERRGARRVVGLLEEEVRDADARQARDTLVERYVERRADDGRGEREERVAAREVARDDVEQLLGREWRGVRELHGLAGGSLVTRERGHRLDDEVYGDDVEAHVSVADVGEREGAREDSQVVDEVVDAVVLRGLARARVAADDRGAVYRDGKLALQRVHLDLGEVLRLLVVVSEARAVPKLGLQYAPSAPARDVAGRDVVVAAQTAYGLREEVDVARALDVDAHGEFARHTQVVDGREVEDGRGGGARLSEV